ncbi:RNA polymerase sigma-70 factor [Zhouia spongiae]|uniref:RNA polymerase sigma-70 factor n=1 Tax=Zhouia spongiae TaxID=2202721 RepID=A0ABY3YLC0_9FLAO|nr:RNA polymerase sigma-70 factor [Zhouia spongiae]UNY98640.1 RNA polymerase sigma-70 factor [Zhouia spongiae]
MSIQNKLIKGDIGAFEKVYNTYFQKVYGIILKYTRDQTFADDLLQDVFIKFWNNRSKIASDLTIEHQLFVLTRSVVFNFLKKSVREKQLMEEYREIHPVVNGARNDEFEQKKIQKLNQLIEALPEKQQKVFTMHKLEGLSYEEIAEHLNISKNTVSSHMTAALNQLKKSNILLLQIIFLLN